MSNLVAGFDATQVAEQDSFEPIPAGWYDVMITDSEQKMTKAGTGSYLQMRLDVTSGQYEGRVLFERLNLDNPNQTAVEIAQRTLSSICRSVGVMQPQDSSDLHNIPLCAKVAIQPPRDGYEASNVIKAYSAASGGGQAAPQQGAAPQQPAPQQSAPKKPWE